MSYDHCSHLIIQIMRLVAMNILPSHEISLTYTGNVFAACHSTYNATSLYLLRCLPSHLDKPFYTRTTEDQHNSEPLSSR